MYAWAQGPDLYISYSLAMPSAGPLTPPVGSYKALGMRGNISGFTGILPRGYKMDKS